MDIEVTEEHCTQEMAEGIAKYCSELMGLLRLPQWTILVMEEACDEDALASIRPIDGRYVAQLRLSSDWMDRSEEEQRATITHEVCHLIHVKVNHVVWDTRDFMHDHEHNHLWGRYLMETEYMVDHLAFFLSNTYKLQETWNEAHVKE